MKHGESKVESSWELKAIRSQIKQILKQKKLAYRDLAKTLGVAEVTVKRFFIADDVSFSKIQLICQALGVSVIDLASLVRETNEQVFHLSVAQESYFCDNERLCDFFVLLLKYKSVKEAVLRGQMGKENIPKFKRELEKLDLAHFPLGDSVQLKKSGVLTWLKGGPLQKKFMRKRHLKYLDCLEAQVGQESAYLASSQRSLRPESLEEMKRDLEFVIQKYRSRAFREETVFAQEQLVGVAWLVGLTKFEQA